MIFYTALIAFFGFLVVYVVVASAIIYHLNAFSLASWTGRRFSIIAFVILSILFVGIAVIFFFQIPWNIYANAT